MWPVSEKKEEKRRKKEEEKSVDVAPTLLCLVATETLLSSTYGGNLPLGYAMKTLI